VQQKVFRVEQMSKTGRAGAAEQNQFVDERASMRARAGQRDDNESSAAADLRHELALIHDTIAHNKRELSLLIGEGKERRMTRAAGELGAAVEGMEKATVQILKAAEVVDESARALAATQPDDYTRGLAQDVLDHVVKVYEACNFQDLAGQRIGNVIRTLNAVEEQVAAMLERCDRVSAKSPAPAQTAPGRGLLNGPKLDGASGHVSQHDIDAMFN
jgi:chemotaxis protein CheZ